MTPSPWSCNPAHAGGFLTVDLDAVVENWRILCRRMPEGRDSAAVVKADAYGLGAEVVGQALAGAGCRTFFVALAEEGIRLRKALPDLPIYVLSGPFPGAIPTFRAHNLRPVLNCPTQVNAWLEHCPDLPYALHVDTGMNRLGLTRAEFGALRDTLAPAVIMSHLACGDEPDNPLNTRQLANFREVRAAFPGAVASLANSPGHFLGPEYGFDLGRPGVAIYGGNPTPGRPNPMKPVVGLELRVIQVRQIDSPQAVGYGATHRVSGGARLATVAAGYADGLLRSLSNTGWGTLAGVRVPVVGRVSMDLITFDVSAVPAAEATPGAFISLLDGEHTVDDLAAEAGTIPYEILTSLGRRYARRYIGGGA